MVFFRGGNKGGRTAAILEKPFGQHLENPPLATRLEALKSSMKDVRQCLKPQQS
jgi:hypothetical protein